MTYEQYVYRVFAEDGDCKGLSEEEIQDIITETPFHKIERFLLKAGYDLTEMYSFDYGRA